ncbi:hypothetical protein [Homoserinibacter sp. GY 40078]|uniref:hypothetical protein n=1 Tax=Homoserinibacter sp. GY 40078 TaxID=2603275 RepID=UPI0011CC6464|nr:hypothetical protein [Homoserinibacter sp. GY 40078]TXK17415.1 hypothetical protein FVQ89_11315 [Homoserinibacter sp. GY 40078]
MTPEILGGLIGLGATLLTVGGVALGHVLSSRVQRRATEVQAVANKKSNEHQMIDQLQEEVGRLSQELTRRGGNLDERLERVDRRNDQLTEELTERTVERDKLRQYAHDLRGHIFDGEPPPPPEWPEGVTK